MATYTSAASGLWSDGATWVGGVKPPSAAGHKIIIAAGHTVTYDEAAGTYGDASVPNFNAINSNAICISGTLAVSRVTSTALTCNGTMAVGPGGVLDYGTAADPIPAGVSATINIVSGGGITNLTNTTYGAVFFKGKYRARRARLTSPVSAGGTSITVDDSTGWEIGDRIALASDTDAVSRTQVVTISGGAAPTWTVSAITNARVAGTRVVNLSSNVIVQPVSGSTAMLIAGAVEIANTRFSGLYTLSNSWQGVPVNGGVCLTSAINNASGAPHLADCALEVIGGASAAALLGLRASSVGYSYIRGSVFYTTSASAFSAGILGLGSAAGVMRDCSILRAATGITSGTTASSEAGFAPLEVYSSEVWGGTHAVSGLAGTILLDESCELRSAAGGVLCNFSTVNVSSSYVSVATLMRTSSAGFGTVTYRECSIAATPTPASMLFDAVPRTSSKASVIARNGSASDNYDMSYYRFVASDGSTTYRSLHSAKIQNSIANTAVPYTFTLPAVAGVAQTIKGSLRFDATYGTATPPRIDLSGQGVTASFVAPATADTWHDFTLTFTPTTTGDITATVTVQSASTAGFAWLDGVWHYPMIRLVRHFGYQWLPQAAQVADTRITLTEAAALALPVSVNHTTSTITVSGPVTAREVFEACIADLCQTANLSRAVHISSATGDTFTTTYTVVLTGSGAITGVYTDATGVNVKVSAPALVAGSRVQVYDVTASAELFNGVLATDGLELPVAWTANHTIRLRADKDDKKALQTAGILTSAGVTFLDVQQDDAAYAALGIDGSTVTEFVADEPNIQIDASDLDGVTEWGRLYAWWQHYQTTSAGIAGELFGRFTSEDGVRFLLDQTGPNVTFRNNIAGTPLLITGGSLTTSDGGLPIDMSAGAGSIFGEFGNSYTAVDTRAAIAELRAIHGLVPGTPLVVTPTSRTAGAIEQSISEAGGEVTVTRTA